MSGLIISYYRNTVQLLPNIYQFRQAICEKVVSGDNNAFVILGRDRPYSFGSGKGAHGGKCGRIHLIAGLAAASDLNEDATTGPNLITDAATVYISQRTNIDEYFGIPEGTNVPSKDNFIYKLLTGSNNEFQI